LAYAVPAPVAAETAMLAIRFDDDVASPPSAAIAVFSPLPRIVDVVPIRRPNVMAWFIELRVSEPISASTPRARSDGLEPRQSAVMVTVVPTIGTRHEASASSGSPAAQVADVPGSTFACAGGAVGATSARVAATAARPNSLEVCCTETVMSIDSDVGVVGHFDVRPDLGCAWESSRLDLHTV